MEEIWDLLAVPSDEKQLDLVYRIDEHVPLLVEADGVRLKQILVNLVANGIKFTQRGEVDVSMTLKEEEQGKHQLEISVCDTGIGIAWHKIERIFKSFAQADGSISLQYGGSGLGLAICVRLVEMMQGKIWVETQPGLGSIFFFTAAIRIREQQSRFGDLYRHECLKGRQLLMLDDNEAKLDAVKYQYEQCGMHLTITSQPAEVLPMLQRSSYDVVILDYTMPGINGLDVGILIRQQAAFAQLPLILYTPIGGLPRARRHYSELFTAVLDRPVKYKILHHVLLSIFSQQ